ncbi:MAG: aldehyde dehydrogenase family protein, partial [Clostridia bacterium]
MEAKKMYIDGKWTEGSSGKTIKVINPANGEKIAEVCESSLADAEAAIAAAKKSFYVTREWRDLDSQSRGNILLKIADKIEEKFEEICKIESMDNGKPLRESEGDISDAAHCFRYYAGLIKTPHGGVYEVNDGFGKMHSYTMHEPVGVCAQITPWNYPMLMATWKLAPALAAGNSIVFKPSSDTVLSALMLFEIFEECGIPAGAVNIIVGPGSTIGNLLSSSPDVDMVTFTGSTEVGKGIMRNASETIKKVGLELGGKSPNVVFADCDFEAAIEWAMVGVFFNQGEVCSAGSRIIIEESIKDKFVARLAERANAMTIGNPLENPDMGPLVSEKHMETVLSYIEKGKAEGATCVCGGFRYTEGECAKGYYVRPTIFDNCTSDMTIVKEEIFGPVVTVQTFKTA